MSFKETWQNFLTKIDNRIPIKKITGPLDKKHPLTSFFILLLILLVVAYLVFGSSLSFSKPNLTEITIKLADSENNILDNFDFKIQNASDGFTNNYVTNSSGSYTLSLDSKKKYFLIVESVGYEYTEEEIDFLKTKFNFIIKKQDFPKNYPKTVYFQDALTEQIITDPLNVTIRCDNGPEIVPNSVDTTSGSVSIEVPIDCEKIYASVIGDKYIEESLSIPVTEQTFKLNVVTEILDVGSLSVYTFSGEESILESITLKLFSVDDPVTPIKTVQTTNSEGIFSSVPVGEYVVKASDIANRYLQNQEEVTVTKNTITDVSITMIDTDDGTPKIIDPDTNQEITIRKITVFVKDSETGEVIDAISSPSVSLLLDGNENIEQRSLDEGFIFNTEEGKKYSLKATAEGYIPGNLIPVVSGKDTYIFNLEKITISNVSNIVVTIQDEDLKPIAGLKSWIYDKDGQYIDPRFEFSTSDENGIIVFENIPDLNFTVKVKNSFIEETSIMYHNNPPEDTNFVLPVEIGTGTVSLTTKNKLNEVVGNSKVTFYSESLEVLGSAFASSNGSLENKIKADKRVFIKIEAEGYLPYFTELFRIYKNKKVSREIVLEREHTGEDVSVEYLGLYNTSDLKVESLKNNEVFYFKFKAIMPSSSDHFNFVFRAGSQTSVLEDVVFIMPQNSSLGIPVYYQTEPFSNSGGFLESKLIDIEFIGYPASVQEITIPVRIKNAAVNDKVSFFYDSSINNINYMTNNYTQLQYFIEATSLCGETFCFSGQYVDVSQDLRYDISENRPISMNIHSDYALEYQILNSSSKTFKDVRLSSRNLNLENKPTAMVNIKEYSISGEFSSTGQTLEGEANFNIPFSGTELSKESLNPFSSINFNLKVNPINLGQSKLSNRLVSLQEEIYNLPISFVVSELESMVIDYEPKNIVPGLPFNLLVTVKDSKGNYLEGVNVNILQKIKNEYTTVSTGKTTNSEGVATINLPSLRSGETFAIEAVKSKYYAENVEFTIQTDVLDVYSQETLLSSTSPLEVFVHKTNINGEVYSLTLQNKTEYPLTVNQFNIRDVSFNKSYLLNLEQTVNYLNNQISDGFIIPANQSRELDIKFAPSESSRTHAVSEDILGAITGHYSLNNYNYLFTIPVKAKLSVGNGVLYDDCLVVTESPEEWTTVVSNNTQSTSFTIKNTCVSKEGQIPIAVKNVQAKISSQGDRYGVYFLNLIGPSSSNQIQLSENYYRIIVDQMAPEEMYTVNLTFNTNGVKFAEVKTNIHLNAQVETEEGLSYVNKEPKDVFLKTNLSVMDLYDCFSYIDGTGKTINSGGLLSLEGIEENQVTIKNNCQGKATFKMDLCDAFDEGCKDLTILNTDEENNVLNFSLNDSEKTVSIKRDSTKAPGAYILNNRVSVVNNFDREVASSYVLLKINAKDVNGLWMEDPFIEINEDKVSEVVRLYNNNIDKTIWHYLNEKQVDFTVNNFNKSYAPFERNIKFTSFDELNSNKGTNSLLWGATAVSGAVMGLSLLAQLGVITPLLAIPVWGWIAGAVLWSVAALAPTFTNVYDIEQDFFATDFDTSYFTEDFKKIDVDNLGSEDVTLSIIDLSALKNMHYYKSHLKVSGKLIKKKKFTNVINKCPLNQEFVSINHNFEEYKGCSIDPEYVEGEDSYKYNISCSGAYPRNRINLRHNVYLTCKNNEQIWPEQSGIKSLQINLEDSLYNQLNNNSKKFFFKENILYPTLDDTNNEKNILFDEEIGKYRFGLFLSKPQETPNYDLSLQDCVTDTGRSGKTGEGAVPNISLNWNWAETDCTKTYCDATQLTQDVLNRIDKAEKLISSNIINCPIVNYETNNNDDYIINAEPGILDNQVPVNKSGINSVRMITEDNLLKIKITLENRSLVENSGTLNVKLSNLSPIKIQKIEENLVDVLITESIPVVIQDEDLVSFVYTYGNKVDPLIAENLQLNVVYNSSNKSLDHSSFNSLLGLSIYEAKIVDGCQISATTAKFNGTSYLDMWLNKEMYPENVVGSGWSQTDVTKLKELLEFDAYLITDNYNQNFKDDFDMAFGGLASKEDGAGTGNYAIMSSPTSFSDGYLSKLFKNNLVFTKEYSSEENVNLNVPGKYRVKIDFVFDNSSWRFEENGDIDANAFVTFRFVSSPESDSIFYRMPFNGFVGMTNSGYDRQGYGVSYFGDSILIDNENVVTDSDFGSNALRTINVTKSNDLSKINSSIETRGNLLSIKYNSNDNVDLIFTPSNPIPLLMSIEKNNNTPLNVVYRLKDKSDNALTSTSLLRWTGVGSGCDFSGSSIYNMSYFDRYSGNEGISSAYIVDWPQVLRTGKIYLRTVFYSPQREEYSLENKSSQGVNVKFSKNGTNFSSSISLGSEEFTGVKSVVDVFNLIRENKVCVVNSYDGKTSDFFYNPSEIFTDKFIQAPSDSLKCS